MADPEPKRKSNRSLNEIPQDLLIRILTFLPTHDSVRSSILSQKWRNLWSSVPSIDFDYKLFPPTPKDHQDTDSRYSNFVDQTLRRRSPIPINRFRLEFDCQDNKYEDMVDSWIEYAVNHTVEELDIDFCNDSPFDFSISWLKGSQVRDLKLRCFREILFPSRIKSLKIRSIRSLDLWSMELEDHTVAALMSVCVNLESLAIEFCKGMKRLKIRSSSVKKLTLGDFDDFRESCGESSDEEDAGVNCVEISCPNLVYMDINDFKMDGYSIKKSTSLVEAHVGSFSDYSRDCEPSFKHWSKVVRLFTDVKHLTVQNQFDKLLCKNAKSSEGLSYRNLEHLELYTGYSTSELCGMAALFDISPNITTLTLNGSISFEECYEPEKILKKPIEFRIPNLKIVYLPKRQKKAEIEAGEEMFVSLIKKHGAALEKIVERYR